MLSPRVREFGIRIALGGSASVLFAAVMLACVVSGNRATSVDPVKKALREG